MTNPKEPTTAERERDKLVLVFKREYETKSKVRYNEQVGDEGYSDRDVAIGYIYPLSQAIEMLGNPDLIKVTIEPID